MANWDIFHAVRLQVEQELTTEAVRQGLASGAILPDDLARPAGSGTNWTRIAEIPDLNPPGPDAATAGDEALDELHLEAEGSALDVQFDDEDSALDAVFDEPDADAPPPEPRPAPDQAPTIDRPRPAPVTPSTPGSDVADELTEVSAWDVAEADAPVVPEAYDPLDEDEDASAFTLAGDPSPEADEIDLTAMVDVAFQLVLFFLVTATTIYFKTLEIPTPEPEDEEAVAQQMRTLDELLDEYILVEIDPDGVVEVDREPVAIGELPDRLRQVRADSLRTGMLLMADFTTPHRNAVAAVDAANDVGLEIAIARPSAPPE